jgi:hypothetical protein
VDGKEGTKNHPPIFKNLERTFYKTSVRTEERRTLIFTFLPLPFQEFLLKNLLYVLAVS